MVRKIIAIILCVLCVASLPLATHAESYNAFNEFDHSVVDSFKALLNNVSIFDHYVLIRSSDYSYMMIVGDLELDGNIITCESTCQIYKLNNGNLINFTDDNITVNLNNNVYYSDLGNTYDLYSRMDVFSFIAIILLFVIALCCLIRPIFNFVLRLKGKA